MDHLESVVSDSLREASLEHDVPSPVIERLELLASAVASGEVQAENDWKDLRRRLEIVIDGFESN